MKVMVIQEEGDARDRLEKFLESGGAEVTVSRPVWPGFFHVASEVRPDVAIVDCSPTPGYGREVAGYLGETGFTNLIKVLAINVAPDEEDRTRKRAPRAKIINIDNLKAELQAINPEFDVSS